MPATTMITVAPTGVVAAKADAPGLPMTLDELVRATRSCADIGAGVVHVHVRGADSRPTLDLDRLTDTVTALRESTDLVVRLSTAGVPTDPDADRLRVLDAGPDSASCPLGTGEDDRWPFVVELHRRMRDRQIVPSYEIVELGQLAELRRLLDEHGAPYGGHVHCVLLMGVPGGMPGTLQALAEAVAALPTGATFSATGVGPATLPVALAALSAGGHLRVGMADTLAYGPGEPVRDNAQLVARAAGLARIAQRPPAPVDEVRALLGIRDRRPARAT